jgi:hypothetical protein
MKPGHPPHIVLMMGGVLNFLNNDVTETIIANIALARWTSAIVMANKTSIDHPTFSARYLAYVLFGSLTSDFHTTIINRIEPHRAPVMK